MTAAAASPHWPPSRVLVPVIAVATLVAFLPTLHNGFVSWDDPENFIDNPHYRGLGPAGLRWMFTTLHMGHYIPLSWVTLGLDYLLWGMNPAGYHLTNLLLHTATAVTLYFLALRLLRLALPAGSAERDLRLGAAAAALLWAVHPLRVESVVWITERRDVLSGLFYVTAALAYVKSAAPEDARGGAPRPRWYWASFALFTAALLSKSITVTLPAALLVLDVYPLRRLGGERGWRQWRVWIEKVPFFAAAAVASAVAFVALLPVGNAASLSGLDVPQRTVLSVYGLAFYVRKLLLPLGLSPLYPINITVTWMDFAFVIAASLFAAVGVRRWPAFTAVWVVYALTLFPVLGFLQNGPQAAADRYTYLSSLGWSLLAGAVIAWRWAGAGVLRSVFAVWLCALAFLTWQQTHVWRDSITLWTQARLISPDSRAPHFNLARAYEQAGRYAEALAEYEEVRRLSRDNSMWYVPIGRMYEKSGAERTALALYRHALAEKPGRPEACQAAARLAARLNVSPPELAPCPAAR